MSVVNYASNTKSIRETISVLPLPICKFRRALDADIEEVCYLMTDQHHELFGSLSPEYHMQVLYNELVVHLYLKKKSINSLK